MTDHQTFSSIPQAHAWLQEQGFDITERSVRNHVEAGMLPARRSRNGKVQAIRLIDVERYARNYLQSVSDDEGGLKDELTREHIREKRMKNDALAGRILYVDEEEQRDAKIFAGFRRHQENSAPERVQRNTSAILALVDEVVHDEDQRAKVHSLVAARQPELIQRDLDFLADMFDQFKGV